MLSRSAESTGTRVHHLIGNLWLQDPQFHISADRQNRLRQLQPHFHELESRGSRPEPSCHQREAFDLSGAFGRFANEEASLWHPARPKDELVRPSGSLNWPLAHHLHNPSFTTLATSSSATADASNPCTWQVLASSCEPRKTLIFDHLARREVDDGFAHYPQDILACHEAWLMKIRQNMSAYVEVCYGRDVEKRMRQLLDLEAFDLWGDSAGVTVYLDWQTDESGLKHLAHILVFAKHPQIFCQPWGTRYSVFQDQMLSIAHRIAKLDYKPNFYQNLKWTFVHRFPRRYPQYAERSRAAHLAVIAAQSPDISVSSREKSRGSKTFKPGSWSAAKSRQNLLADPDVNAFLRMPATGIQNDVAPGPQRSESMSSKIKENTRQGSTSPLLDSGNTKISALLTRDPSKPSPLHTKCRDCSGSCEDIDPRWHLKSGKYVAKKRKCVVCLKATLEIPADDGIKYVQYASLAVSLSRVGKTYFRPWAKDWSKVSVRSQIDVLEGSAFDCIVSPEDTERNTPCSGIMKHREI